MQSLYDRIGGAQAVNAAVDLFYQRLLADDRVRHFFDGMDMQRQARHQAAFLTYAFGGSSDYPGLALRVAHQRLVDDMGLNDSHFDAVLENLETALRELEVPEELINEALGIAESTRDDVLNRISE